MHDDLFFIGASSGLGGNQSGAKKEEFFIALGGDHSCAIETGVAEGYRQQRRHRPFMDRCSYGCTQTFYFKKWEYSWHAFSSSSWLWIRLLS